MELPTDQGSDQITQPVTWVDYVNIGVSLVLGAFLMWTAIDTLMMIGQSHANPTGGPGTPRTVEDAPAAHTANGHVRLIKDRVMGKAKTEVPDDKSA